MVGRGNRTGGPPPGGEVSFFLPDDPSHPLYLHPSDNPGAILVTELLNGTNYINWSRSMKTALLAKNKLGFITGSVKKPTDLNDPLLPFWERCNGMVVSWLRNSTIPQVKSSLMYLESASQIWSDLHDRFSQGNKARIYELKQQLFGLHQGASDINAYYTNLRIIWDELIDTQPKEWCTCTGCRCNSVQQWRDFQQSDFTMHFLMGLNDSYSHLRSQFLSLDPFPSFSKIFSLVLQKERQRDIGHGLIPSPHASPMSESPAILSNATQNFGNRTREKYSAHTVTKLITLLISVFFFTVFPPVSLEAEAVVTILILILVLAGLCIM